MIIEIAAQGGFGGIAAMPPKRIDPEQQGDALRKALHDAFAPEALSRMEAVRCPSGPDRLRYAITVIDGHDRHSVILSEGQIPPEMLDLIDRL